MKCDVCGTKIPLGESICPNCGYRVKKDAVTSFDASQQSHEHIRIKSTKRKASTHIPFTMTDMSSFQTPKWIIGIVVAFVVAAIIMIVIPTFSQYSDNFNDWSEMSFQEVIDLGEGEGTVELAKSSLEEVKNFMSHTLQLEDVSSHEYCSHYDDSIQASFSVYGYYNDVYYSVNYAYDNKQLLSTDLMVSGSSQESIKDLEVLPMDKNIVTKLGEFMNIQDVYESFDQGRLKIVKLENSEDEYGYSHSESPYIFINEKVHSANDYEYYCSVSGRYF